MISILSSIAALPLIAPALPAQEEAPRSFDISVPQRVDFTFDQDVLYITSGSELTRFDVRAGASLPPLPIGGNLMGIDALPGSGMLAVADSTTQNGTNRVHLVDIETEAITEVRFPLEFGEVGTFMVAWAGDGTLLISSSYGGSGWTPLRKYDPLTQQVTDLGNVRQNTMLTPSADRMTIALAESNISSGPVRAYNVSSGLIDTSINTGWFTFEVAVSPHGRSFCVPTYSGAFGFARRGTTFVPKSTIGQYATWGPIGAVYSPTADVLYTAEWGANGGVKAYQASTWQELAVLDNQFFSWSGNHALDEGRLEISPDGRLLAASIVGGVRVYRVQP